MYNFDESIMRRGTGSIKWDFGEKLVADGTALKFDEKTLPLFVADMDLAVPPFIVDAMHQVADTRIYGYTLPTPEYYASIVQWFSKRHQWKISKEDIIYCPGTVYALEVAIKAFTRPKAGVIIQRPVYNPFSQVIEDQGRSIVNNPMIKKEDGSYEIDFLDFEKCVKNPETTLFILCNPQNPTGKIYTVNELRRLYDICRHNGVMIVADEIHGDLIRKNATFKPLASVVEGPSNIITLTAINKTFNVAGLKVSNVIISDPEKRAQFTLALGEVEPSPFAYRALIAAYSEGEAWLEALKVYLDGNIDWVIHFCKKNLPKVKVHRPEGTYILWLDFRAYDLEDTVLKTLIYKDANVVLSMGTKYDPDQGRGFKRVCLGSPRGMIVEAFHRIYEVLKGYN